MVKAIFFDVDGTLVSFQTHQMSKRVLEALHQLREKGIRLFVSTGRHQKMLSYIQSVFPFDGYITLSGQYCYCGDQVLRSNPMPRDAVQGMVDAARSREFSFIFLEGEEIYLNCVDQYTLDFMKDLDLPLPPVIDPSHALDRPLYQGIAFLTKEKEHLLFDRASNLTATRWHPYFLDIIPPTGGKDKGMDAILEHFGIPLEESMAFGDGENDLSMLVHAGIGVAMGSASDAVKGQADYVTGTVDEDGILTALEHFGVL